MEYIRQVIKVTNTASLVEALDTNKDFRFVGAIPWGDLVLLVLEKNQPRKYTKKVKEPTAFERIGEDWN